jgi:hypothetical protein
MTAVRERSHLDILSIRRSLDPVSVTMREVPKRERAALLSCGLLPAPRDQSTYSLPPAYVEQAVRDVALQLSRAGVRLALILNRALGASG